jgi:predicted O-methyltransferase YrrM
MPATTEPTPTKRLKWSRIAVRFAPGGARITQLFNDLEGLISIREAQFLYRIARGRQTIVEIGPHRGKSTVLLALGAGLDQPGNQTRFVSIDPHGDRPGVTGEEDFNAFHDTLKRYNLDDRIDHWRRYSQEAADDWDGSPIDLLWIDGSHDYQDKVDDLEKWGRFVRPGGVVVAHDVFRPRIPDVLRAWGDTIQPNASWGPTRKKHSIAWAQRVN